MKLIKGVPLRFRLQNYLIDSNYWTSATKTYLQMITRYFKKDDSEMCNTSEGYTVPFHGQYVRIKESDLMNSTIFSTKENDYTYNIKSGILLDVTDSTLPNLSKIRKFSSKYLQGLAFNENSYDLAVFGKPDKKSIDLFDMNGELVKSLDYSDFKKWWWSYWESEGVQYDNKGNVYLIISVKSKFGFIRNYTHYI